MSHSSIMRARCLGVALLALLTACASTSESDERVVGVIIAHRGASGHAPEHTLEAYSMGHAMGADFIEPDLVMSKDGHLICSHDTTVRKSSNVSTLYPKLVNQRGQVWLRDLSLEELSKVTFTDEAGEGSYRYVSFKEFLDLMALLELRDGEKIGIIPELKAPAWHRSIGLPMEKELVERLAEAGYQARTDSVIIQCFEKDTFRRLRVDHLCPFPQVLCLGKESIEEDLVWAAEFCDGVAPHRATVEDKETGAVSELVKKAHALGLAVFPYTFGDEEEVMRRYLHEYGVEGVFTDFPDAGVAARAEL